MIFRPLIQVKFKFTNVDIWWDREREGDGGNRSTQGKTYPSEQRSPTHPHTEPTPKLHTGHNGKLDHAFFPGITAAVLTIPCKAYGIKCSNMVAQPTRLISGNSRQPSGTVVKNRWQSCTQPYTFLSAPLMKVVGVLRNNFTAEKNRFPLTPQRKIK